MISHDRSRGQTVEIEANYSILRLPHVTGPRDSGNYTCSPHNLRPDMVAVHILGGNSESGLKSEVIAAEETAAAAVQDQDESGIQGSQISDFHSSANRIDCFNTVNVATKNLTLILKLLTMVITAILVSGDFRANCS